MCISYVCVQIYVLMYVCVTSGSLQAVSVHKPGGLAVLEPASPGLGAVIPLARR